MPDSIYIPGDVPSSKNSKIWTGKFLVNSKATQRYKKESKKFYQSQSSTFREWSLECDLPLKVEFTFLRKTKRKFDYINILQIVQDMMVEYDWIEDDNCDVLIPIFKPYHHDKLRAGVLISKPLTNW